MILAHHLILSMYGFWLPNDPRGSWSEFVGAWELLRFGKATTVRTTRSLAHMPHDRAARLAARQALKYPAVRLSGVQARAVGRGFSALTEKTRLTVWACAILPDHVHLVIAAHRLAIERIAVALKGAATRQLVAESIHPLTGHATRSGRPPKVFARGLWKVFLDSTDDVLRAVRYVEHNPIRERRPAQRWRFVQPFEQENARSAARRG